MGGDATTEPLAKGTLLARRFVLQYRLAVGGSGEVWVAVNRATGGVVALKLVRRKGSSAHALARFRHEASLSAALGHRNIVRVYDFFEEPDGTLGLVMECLRGENARERLQRTGPLSPHAAVAIATQVLSALEHAHEHDIIHRDIKPPNIFLATDPDGNTTAKLLDFGIARTERSTVHTLHGQLLGTPQYMSPEQIRAEPSLDGRSDLFSLAVVLYELLTGRNPFTASFATASLASVLEVSVVHDERIPAPLWAVLERALAKDASLRYASARELATALRVAMGASDARLSLELHRSRPPPPMLTDETCAPIELAPSSPPGNGAATGAREVGRRRRSSIVVAVVAAAMTITLLGGARALTSSREGSVATAAATPAPQVPTPAVATADRAAPVPAVSPDAGSVPIPFSLVQSRAPTARPAARALAPKRPRPASNRSGVVTDPGF